MGRKKKKIKQQYRNITVRIEDFHKLEALAKGLHITKVEFIHKILEPLWDTGNEFLGNSNMGVVIDFRGNKSQFIFYGKSDIIQGGFPSETELPESKAQELIRKDAEKQFSERREENDK